MNGPRPQRGAARAAVFAYSEVGVRGLLSVLAAGIDVPLVMTHRDDPGETRWFGSVAETARDYGLKVLLAEDLDAAALLAAVRAARCDFLFSFYFRQLLPDALLALAPRGALNLHGSLLPKYRGRAPVNWAILRGERETGATLHYMVTRADAGDIVDQQSVPILPDDTAAEVSHKVAVAAEIVLQRSLPLLVAGTAPRRRQEVLPGQYFGRRRPADGRIDWSRGAAEIHDLVRAVAPPFPGAWCQLNGRMLYVHATRLPLRAAAVGPTAPGEIVVVAGACHVGCGDGQALRLVQVADEHGPVPIGDFIERSAGQRLS